MRTPVSTATCLVCKSRRNYPLARWDEMPLSVLGLPRSSDEAKKMATFVMDVRRCARCGHVFHSEFDYEKIPYRSGSNLVYNRGHYWKRYQEELAQEWIEEYDLKGGCVLEIGCGEGTFLAPFQAAGNRCIGFEPGQDAAVAEANGVEAYQEYFQGTKLFDLEPDAIVCRHVIEHLADPLDFVQEVAMTSQMLGIRPLFLAEVPLIEKALKQNRINDFLYEHVSNFTLDSFRYLFELAGFEVLDVRARYNGEVVTIAARPIDNALVQSIHDDSEAFKASLQRQVSTVQDVIDEWRDSGRRVALWGATGKGAALVNMFDLTERLTPVVIDSDQRKVGGFVPGKGQRIEGPEYLDEHPVDVILICTNWRARDIEHEIREVHGLDAELFVYYNERITPLTPEVEL